jgi:hypothetical protein
MTGLTLRRFELNNRAAAANVGIGFRWANRYWGAGQLVAADTPDFTDDTTDAQDAPVTTADFPLSNTTASDGWAVHSDRQFSWVSVLNITASVGASSTVTASYSDFAGTGWTAITEASQTLEPSGNTLLIIDTENYGATEERMLVWAPANNWGKTAAAGLDGIPGGRYAMRFLNNVSTTAPVASVIEVGSMVAIEQLATLGVYANDQSTFSDPYADAVVAFFSIADAGNRVLAEVTTGI